MKTNKIFRTSIFLSLSTFLAFGVASGLSLKNDTSITEAKAESYKGSVFVKIGSTSNWGIDNAKLAVYFWNDNVNGTKKEGWSNLVDIGGTNKTNTWYELNYSFDFEPEKMNVTRQKSGATSASWNNRWNQSGDLSFATCAYVNGDWDPNTTTSMSSWNQKAIVYSNKTEGNWGEKAYLDSFKINSSSHLELSGKVTLEKDEKFKIKDHDGKYYNSFNGPDAVKSLFSLESTNDKNIVCSEAGTYEFYFDVQDNTLWITNEAIVAADSWAQYFNTNVGCDSSGKKEPTGWDNVKSRYNELITTNESKNFIYNGLASNSASADNLSRALWNYDMAIKNHSNLEKFIKNSAGEFRTPASSINKTINTISTNVGTGIIAIIVVTIIGITTIGAFVFVKTRKHI